jgi:hypothetical protein
MIKFIYQVLNRQSLFFNKPQFCVYINYKDCFFIAEKYRKRTKEVLLMRTRTNYVAIRAEEERGAEFKLVEHAVKILYAEGKKFTKENILNYNPAIDECYLDTEEIQKYLKKKTSDAKNKKGIFNEAAKNTIISMYNKEMKSMIDMLDLAIDEMMEAEIDITAENIIGLYDIPSRFIESKEAAAIISDRKNRISSKEVIEIEKPVVKATSCNHKISTNKKSSDVKYQRVKKAIEELLSNNKEITFDAVCKKANVSKGFLKIGSDARKLFDTYHIPAKEVIKNRKDDNCKVAREAFEELKATGKKIYISTIAAKANISAYYVKCDEELCKKVKSYNNSLENVSSINVVMESSNSKLDAVDIRYIKDIIDYMIIEQPAGIIELKEVAKIACVDLSDIKKCVEINNYVREVNVKLHTKGIIDRTIKQIINMRKTGRIINIYTVIRENTDGIDINFIKSHSEILECIENNRSI